MNVQSIISDLASKYPNQAERIRAWLPEYDTRLSRYAGERLAEAYRVTMTGWQKAWCPLPADIAANLPGKSEIAASDDQAELFASERAKAQQRVEDAIEWWRSRGYDLASFWEYNHRRRQGEPSAEDLLAFETQARATARSLSAKPSPAVSGLTKPNYLSRQREVVRAAPSGVGTTAVSQDADSAATAMPETNGADIPF